MYKNFTLAQANKEARMKKILLLILSSIPMFLDASKVLIITHVHSRPDFIELQHKTFKAFLKDEYEYVVFNDAPNQEMCVAMERVCNRLNIQCIRVPQTMHANNNNAGHRHMNGIRYSLEKLGFDHQGIVLMLDSDMFLIKPLHIAAYLQSYDLLGLHQERTENNIKISYLWPGLLFMNMKMLPNKRTIDLDGNRVHGVATDTGGHLHNYLTNNPLLCVKRYEAISSYWLPNHETELKTLGYDDQTINFILTLKRDQQYSMEFHLDGQFVHYYAGGCNWTGLPDSYHKHKTSLLNNFIDQIIKKDE